MFCVELQNVRAGRAFRDPDFVDEKTKMQPV